MSYKYVNCAPAVLCLYSFVHQSDLLLSRDILFSKSLYCLNLFVCTHTHTHTHTNVHKDKHTVSLERQATRCHLEIKKQNTLHEVSLVVYKIEWGGGNNNSIFICGLFVFGVCFF